MVYLKLKKLFVTFLFSLLVVPVIGSVFHIGAMTYADDETAQEKRFDQSLFESIDTDDVRHLKKDSIVQSTEGGGATIRNIIINKTIKIVIPIAIAFGVFLSILGLYRMVFSEDAETTKIGFQYLLYGVIAILIMMSARYLTDVITGDIMKMGMTGTGGFTFDAPNMVFQIYEKIAFPFIKVLLYLVLGGLFIILAMQLIKYIFSTDDKAKKGAITIMSWNIIGMLVIIGSKQIIEAIYGSQESIVNANAQTLGDVGDAVLATKELPILYSVINRIMGLTSLVVLIIIIRQSFQLLTKPDDSNQFGKIKKSLLYIFIGILVIGAGYLITNFLIIN